MIQSTRAISLVLVSAVSVLGGYRALKPAPMDYNDQDEWGDSSTRPAGSHYYGSGYHSSYYHHYNSFGSPGYSGGSSPFSSSGSHSSSSSSHGTSHGGFGSTGHAAHS